MKLKISITTEPIGFSILWRLHTGPLMVLSFFKTDPLDSRGVTTSNDIKQILLFFIVNLMYTSMKTSTLH